MPLQYFFYIRIVFVEVGASDLKRYKLKNEYFLSDYLGGVKTKK
jgi:hypothetical protein